MRGRGGGGGEAGVVRPVVSRLVRSVRVMGESSAASKSDRDHSVARRGVKRKRRDEVPLRRQGRRRMRRLFREVLACASRGHEHAQAGAPAKATVPLSLPSSSSSRTMTKRVTGDLWSLRNEEKMRAKPEPAKQSRRDRTPRGQHRTKPRLLCRCGVD
ncbi:hypothetical protein AAT19DRAFT_11703 [Rhodotorula toruloides]|uniref:Uncharacterized protein n=1 Tax=Rhodotorula toruloides TaxID=5286 RepID=A0A2S9ZWA7_RHOTO|nr:hypothetical protein AAT19DRAFT_11703 [Rhodotorula toruloides]